MKRHYVSAGFSGFFRDRINERNPLPSRFALLVTVALGVLGSAGVARAQAGRFELTVQASKVPLYSGNRGGSSSYSGLGPGVRLGFRPGATPGRTLVEMFFTRTAADGYYGKPQLSLWGVQVGRSLRPPAATGINALWALGIGHMDIVASPFIPCTITLGCLREGGAEFRSAGTTTLVGDAGLVLPLARAVAVRGDLRLHQPLAISPDRGDSGATRFEFAAGFTLRW